LTLIVVDVANAKDLLLNTVVATYSCSNCSSNFGMDTTKRTVWKLEECTMVLELPQLLPLSLPPFLTWNRVAKCVRISH